MGMTRYGKTTWVKQRIARAERLLVWDIRPEYHTSHGCRLVKTTAELSRALLGAWDGPARISYWGPIGDFQEFAKRAMEWSQIWPATIVIEEICDVTGSGAACGAWGELVRKGLYYGSHVYAITQRPQELDKTTLGNSAVKHTHFFDGLLEQKYIAERVLAGVVTPEEIGRLQKGEWIERRVGHPGVFRGRTSIAA